MYFSLKGSALTVVNKVLLLTVVNKMSSLMVFDEGSFSKTTDFENDSFFPKTIVLFKTIFLKSLSVVFENNRFKKQYF